MVILNKIYTKSGDKGETSLGNGERISKTSLRVEAYGTVDELNSFVGSAISYSSDILKNNLKRIQNDLFDIGADLCTPVSETEEKLGNRLRILESQILWLEENMDEMNENLSPLKSFILPGGSKLSSTLHICRTVCRRTERLIVRLANSEKINQNIIMYINRLSDWFFISARVANNYGKEDNLWVPGANR